LQSNSSISADLSLALQAIADLQAEVNELQHQVADLTSVNQVLRERECLANEQIQAWKKTNQVLQRSLDSLATEPNLEKFLGQVLGAIAEQFNSPLAEYWYHFEGDVAYIEMMSWNGQSYSRDEIATLYPTHPGIVGVTVPADLIHGETLQDRKKYFIIEDWLTHPFVKHVRWMPEHGFYKEINVPMVFGDQCIGALVVRMARDQPITSQQISLAEALTRQATLAVELTKLAEEAKQAAITREQEKAAQEWASELAKANLALRQSIDALTAQPEIERFLSVTLRSISEVLEVPSACLWRYEGEFAYLQLVYQDGQVLPAEQTDHPNAKQPAFLSQECYDLGVTLRTQPYIVCVDDLDVALTYAQRTMLQRLKVRDLLFAPIMIGDRVVGSITARLTHDMPHPPAGRLKLVHTLANQAALALQMSKLAEEAKQSAIAREQEKLAKERAIELQKANDALKRSLDALSTNPKLDSFISQVLVAISDQFGAEVVEFWGHRDAKVAYPISVVVKGQTVSAAEMESHPWKDGIEVPPEIVDYVPLDRRTRHFIVKDNRTDSATAEYWIQEQNWYEARGIQLSTQLNIPLTLGGRSPGALAIYLPSNHRITDEQIEIGYALAHQLGLAVELTRLASQSTEMALIDERNRMAQEIHDTLAQSFTGILIQLETLKQDGSKTSHYAALRRIHQLAEDGLVEARRSVRSLRPRDLDNSNLFTALPQLVERLSSKSNIPIQLTLTGDPYPLPADTAGNLFRIAQEAIQNALKHAQPNTIFVELLYEPETVMLSVEDDGQGFDPQQQILPTGFGIVGMQERATRIRGQFSLSSAPGKGTTITVIVENNIYSPSSSP